MRRCNYLVSEDIQVNKELTDAFFLGVRCAEHAATLETERSKALFRTLLAVAKGELSLIDSPEETAAKFGGIPQALAIARQDDTETRRRDREIARAILQLPEEMTDETNSVQ